MYEPEHEKLAVYEDALIAVGALDVVARAIPYARADLRQQLQRAAASIPLNLAEGASEYSPADKARFYRMAKRSGGECLATLDVLRHVLVVPPNIQPAREALLVVMEGLTKLIFAMQRR